MLNIEHLIENGIIHLRNGGSYETFLKELYNQEMLKEVSATYDELWYMCQHIVYSMELADSETKIALPVSVGQTMYWLPYAWEISFCKHENKMPSAQECEVTCLSVTQNRNMDWRKKFRVSKVVDGRRVDSQRNYNFNDIGNTIFFTRDDANNALKKSASYRAVFGESTKGESD